MSGAYRISYVGGQESDGGLAGLFLSSTIEAAGTMAKFSRLDLDLLSWVDGSLGGVIPEGLLAIWCKQTFCTTKSNP